MQLDQFDEFLKNHPIVISYFSTPQCSVCKVLRPKIEKLIENYNEVVFKYIDTTKQPELAGQYSIFAVPSILIFVEGKESKRLSRNFSVSEVHQFLERMTRLI
ncbi:MAG: thioredoxin [Calditrichaeota bacterium]|nr:MAG: thioredoxin [Calditrichota bacterium]MBL1205933.1 thioredoxin [Calditrichota bacterium]NOG45761.1 thioredoxin family protein [Calditrichota bacterium]